MSAQELSFPIVGAVGSEVGSGRATRVRYLVLAAACGLAVVTYLHRVGFALASARLKGPLGLNDQHVSYFMAAFLLAYGLFEVPWGLLGDRLGVRNLLATIVLGGSLATGGVALVVLLPRVLAWQLAFLLVLRSLFGMFQAGTFPALSRMLTDWMPITERGSAQGLVWMSSRLGGMLAPLLLMPLFKSLGNWQIPLVILAVLGGIWCAGFWPWFRNRPEEMPQVSAQERKLIGAGRSTRPGSGHAAVPWARMGRSKSVWSLCLMYGFLGYSGNFFVTLLPTYLQNRRHLSEQSTGVLTSLPFGFGILACVVGGVLSDAIIKRTGSRRWGRRLVGAAGMALAGLAIVAVPAAGPTWLLAVLLTLTFVGNDLAMGPAWAAAADIGERYAGTLGGTMNMLASLTAAVAALLTGFLLERRQLTVPFLLFAGSYWLGALCWLGVDVTRTLADSRANLGRP
jgi:MFS transporter, ACS family, glucarate transporter